MPPTLPPSPPWTISSSSSAASSPHRTPPSAFTSPPLSPISQQRRQRAITMANRHGWLTAPRARQVMQASTAAYASGTLPKVRTLTSPRARSEREDDLCDKLNRILDFSDHHDHSSSSPLKAMSRWLEPGSFARTREKSSQRLLEHFDRHVLSGVLLRGRVAGAPPVTVKWSNRLYKTAGLTYMKRRAVTGERTALIELSTKVVDEPDRLYNTLAHEMCHAATWIIDDSAKPPHGPVFKSWAARFSRWDPSLKITTCHDYDIRYKFNYECQSCGQTYGRHSRSININKQVCGRCRGTLTLLKKS